ncbi:MAG: TIR domain-containing protein [Gammaproteobacteria bacterium]|nr:TIR domain-containing protein [Gammaproteobacteria bacterium]
MDKPFPAYQGDEPYVFVCYAHTDADVVFPELVWLREQGINFWYDEGIAPGSEWSGALADAIERCAAVLLYVSPRSVQSEPCRREINFALTKQRAILVTHLEETVLPGSLELSLTHRQALLRYELSEPVYRDRLQASLTETIGRPASVVAPTRPAVHTPTTSSMKRRATVGIAAVTLIVLAGFLWRAWFEPITTIVPVDGLRSEADPGWPDDYPVASLSGMAFPLPATPSIAVLPFRTIGDDLWPFRHVADRERLRDGLRLGGLPAMGPKDNQIPLEVEGATTVSIDRARQLHENGITVVDVRGLSDRNIGFIPGSTFLNLQTSLSEAALRAVADPDQDVLFHCEGMR